MPSASVNDTRQGHGFQYRRRKDETDDRGSHGLKVYQPIDEFLRVDQEAIAAPG